MFNVPHHAAVMAKGIFYIAVGIILGLSALNILTGSVMHYLIAAVALYFIAYGIFLSGAYDTVAKLFNKYSK